MDIILASSSPRRIELLSWLNIPYHAAPSPLDEKSIRNPDPAELTRLLAAAKAASVRDQHPESIIIGSDAVIGLDGTILEKPQSADEQRAMLYAQRGKSGQVFSSVCIVNAQTETSTIRTKVTTYKMPRLTDEQIESYVASGQGLDKAGGFGLQDENGLFIEHLDGCYTNALGFPLCDVQEMLRHVGIDTSVDINSLVRQRTGYTC